MNNFFLSTFESVVVFLGFIWPVLLGWILLRFFPNFVVKFFEKEIDRRSDIKLENVKAELQAHYSTLSSSVGVLSNSNSAIHPHMIEAISALWIDMLELKKRCADVFFFDTIVTREEAHDAFKTKDIAKELHDLRNYENEDYLNGIVREFDSRNPELHRLFCGEKLWLIFFVYRAVTLRGALFISWSFNEKEYRDWREDKQIEQLLCNILTTDAVRRLQHLQFGGLSEGLNLLEAEFLKEATRVMSGSKAMADSLSDMQATMKLHVAQLSQRDVRQ